VKSKAEEMEYERPWAVRLALPARLALSNGSSFSRDNLREEEMPEMEEDREVRLSSGSEEAREASSRESRADCEGFWISEKPSRDMTMGLERFIDLASYQCHHKEQLVDMATIPEAVSIEE